LQRWFGGSGGRQRRFNTLPAFRSGTPGTAEKLGKIPKIVSFLQYIKPQDAIKL
jgi:hypothetical protein